MRTKLHRPPAARDFVYRQALNDRLEEGLYLPLTLVSAPAGYGKSTLISHWIASRNGPAAWLSLDESHNDQRTFVSYVVAAVRTIFPEACRKTLDQLEAHVPLSEAGIIACLANDLDELENSFILTLDDYHRVNDQAVHDLVGHLVEHKAHPMHLVIISRHDPPLPLATLRAHHHVNEIRLQDLQFTERETAAFLEMVSGAAISRLALERTHAAIEGWAVGLRLVALTLQHHEDVDAFLEGFEGDTPQIHEYLIKEDLSQQSSERREWLRKTSILDRFSAPLCETGGLYRIP
jgi:LuxR family maltose regulon positive regulatory protein